MLLTIKNSPSSLDTMTCLNNICDSQDAITFAMAHGSTFLINAVKL